MIDWLTLSETMVVMTGFEFALGLDQCQEAVLGKVIATEDLAHSSRGNPTFLTSQQQKPS